MAASISDDDIIRKRLLIDGDGIGDDKRVSTLMKTFMKWCNTPGSEEESNATYQRMLAQLAQCEHAMEKTQLIHNMNIHEINNYEQLYTDIEQSIEDAHTKIGDCKQELQHAKRVRKNRQEYDALAKVIQQHPDRQQTMRRLEELQKELKTLKDSREGLEAKMEMRQKQFHVLVTSIHELQAMLEEDEKDEDEEEQMDTGSST
ncbi:THO complex subunit 7 homolog isoform X1 [Branchiostoma floridae x Branchiostoma belcheri]